MFLGVSIIAILFFYAILYNTNKSNRSFQSKPKSEIAPRRVTIHSIEKAKNNHTTVQPRHIEEFEKVMEEKFYQHMAKCSDDTSYEIKNNPQIFATLLMEAIMHYAKSLKTNMCNSKLNSVLSNHEIVSIIDRVEKKVLKESFI